jgi:hypothetical protein
MSLKKTGHNKFASYYYFELGDFLIPALSVFHECGLLSVTSFDKDVATMMVIDIDKPDDRIVFTSPFGSAALKGAHEVQNVGACETYARRYLWVAALEIVEHDALDATTGKDDKSVSPAKEVAKDLQPEVMHRLRKIVPMILAAGSGSRMLDVIDAEQLDNDEKVGLWSLLDSKTRATIKQAQKEIE